jgi:hypothetical protein
MTPERSTLIHVSGVRERGQATYSPTYFCIYSSGVRDDLAAEVFQLVDLFGPDAVDVKFLPVLRHLITLAVYGTTLFSPLEWCTRLKNRDTFRRNVSSSRCQGVNFGLLRSMHSKQYTEIRTCSQRLHTTGEYTISKKPKYINIQQTSRKSVLDKARTTLINRQTDPISLVNILELWQSRVRIIME